MTTALDQSNTLSGVEAGQWLQMYRRMVMIRLFEEQVNDLDARQVSNPARRENQALSVQDEIDDCVDPEEQLHP